MSTTTDSDVRRGRVPRDTLATRVRLAREESRLSQRAAAEQCGLTFGEWQGIESGRDSRGLNRKIELIAKGLGYDRDWLMWGGPLDHAEAYLSSAGNSVNRDYRAVAA